MKAQDINQLSEQQLKDLMYAICRSGRVVMIGVDMHSHLIPPQYYFAEHIKNFTGSQPTEDDMSLIQSVFESDWSTHEYLDDATQEIVDNNLVD
jgi:hypothetical protein